MHSTRYGRNKNAFFKNLGAAHGVARKLEALERRDSIADFGPDILDIMRGVDVTVWQLLDEQPGRFGYMKDRFYMLRRVRNHPDWGRKLFDGLKR